MVHGAIRYAWLFVGMADGLVVVDGAINKYHYYLFVGMADS